jgi:hypothetical protein
MTIETLYFPLSTHEPIAVSKKRQRDLLNDKFLKGFFYGESGYAWTFQIPTDMVHRCLVGPSACIMG